MSEAVQITKNNDFSKGPIWKCIVVQAIPLTLAQIVQLLYNVVDRIYIGHLPGADSMALTGIGLTFPVVTLIMAFASLFGMGGTPLFSIARGAKEDEEAEYIMGNVFTLLLITSCILFTFCFIFRKPILYLFGASDESFVYADEYLRVYLFGLVFSMIVTGMNGFINAQGFPGVGMFTTVIGAVLNMILDPIFIFGMHMGVTGAAVATVISQMVSAIWVIMFLTGKKPMLKLKRSCMWLQGKRVRDISQLGLSGFIMHGTNCVVQVICNVNLQVFGGDLYVGIMTVLNSVKEILGVPVGGISSGAQPVLGFTYGAKEFKRLKEGMRFAIIVGIAYAVFAWILVMTLPEFFFKIFSDDADILSAGPKVLHIYFFGFIFMAFQYAGQSIFQALGFAKRAIFFSMFRKVIIVIPLILILPQTGLGVYGVFLAEPISNAIGGILCFTTMWLTVYRKL